MNTNLSDAALATALDLAWEEEEAASQKRMYLQEVLRTRLSKVVLAPGQIWRTGKSPCAEAIVIRVRDAEILYYNCETQTYVWSPSPEVFWNTFPVQRIW